MRVFGIVGRQNSGKTHLIVRLVRAFGVRGVAVATIKHTHHHAPQVDRPGSDSARHFEAGAAETVLASDAGWVLFHRSAAPPSLDEIAERIAPCELLLVEGYKHLESLERLEVFRPAPHEDIAPAAAAASGPANAAAPLALVDRGIRAVACPREAALSAWPMQALRLDLDDTESIAEHVLSCARALSASEPAIRIRSSC